MREQRPLRPSNTTQRLSRQLKDIKDQLKSRKSTPPALVTNSKSPHDPKVDSVHTLVTEVVNNNKSVVRTIVCPIVTTRRINPLPKLKQPIVHLEQEHAKTSPPVQTTPKVAIETTTWCEVYRIGDIIISSGAVMKHLGIDIGTKTVVLAFRDGENAVKYVSEINGYWPFERATPFVEHMLSDATKVRSDGTKRPARWIKLNDKIIVLGKDAEELAYAKNDTLLRPMAEGGVSSDEEAMTVLSSIVQGMIETAERDLGKFSDEVKVCFCTTAGGLNKEVNIQYHERVVSLILDGYETKAKLSYNAIKESHAIVVNMSNDGTGIGISWGAGTVTVSYVKYGLEVYSFCWVGAGDWIDEQVAKRFGYDPLRSKTMAKTAKETPTTVARRKMEIDLTPGKIPEDRVGMDIALHYDVLINNVINGIISGFVENEANARIDEGISIYMAGGTSSPRGFTQRVSNLFDAQELPFRIKEVKRSDKPLFCVAEGCLKAAEMF